jgi:hypothetical protein
MQGKIVSETTKENGNKSSKSDFAWTKTRLFFGGDLQNDLSIAQST